MQTIQVIINTILSIWTSVKSLLGFFKDKKLEKNQVEEMIKEEKKESKVIDDSIRNSELDKLNDIAGWKN